MLEFEIQQYFFVQAFIAFSALLAVAAADVSSHATIQHGHGPAISHAVHQPHHGPAIVHAPLVAHPHALHHPLAHHGLIHHPVVHHPVVHHPVVAHPAVVKVAHPAPVVAHPAPYHAPAPAPYVDGPAVPPVYGFEYGVADDYSKATFSANEARDGYKTTGSYRVALPDGRTQIVNYHVDDAAGGYVADVTYEGVAAYPPAPAPGYHAAPAPAYHAAPAYPAAPAPAPATEAPAKAEE